MKFLLPFLLLVGVAVAGGCATSASSVDPAAAVSPACGSAIQVRNPLPRLTSDAFTVVDASADGNCLTVTLSATGCSSQGWTVNLWAAERLPDEPLTDPAALLVFDDGVGEDEMTCQAIMEESYQFDLSPYLAGSVGPTTLELTGTGTTVALE